MYFVKVGSSAYGKAPILLIEKYEKFWQRKRANIEHIKSVQRAPCTDFHKVF